MDKDGTLGTYILVGYVYCPVYNSWEGEGGGMGMGGGNGKEGCMM